MWPVCLLISCLKLGLDALVLPGLFERLELGEHRRDDGEVRSCSSSWSGSFSFFERGDDYRA